MAEVREQRIFLPPLPPEGALNNAATSNENMNNNESVKVPAVLPYQWLVTGVCDRCIYVYCKSTARMGIIEDPSEAELSRAQCVDISDGSCITIPDASYRWEDSARVRLLDFYGSQSTACFLRDTLKQLLGSRLSHLELGARTQARRAAIDAFEGLILRLDCLEVRQRVEELKRGQQIDADADDIPF